MPDEILIRFSVKDDGSPVIERVNQKLKQTQKETSALAPGIEKARMATTDFISANAGLIAVATGAALALKKMYDIAKEGAVLEYTSQKFDRLAQSIGTTSDVMLSQLKEATKGTLSDMEAMALASDLLSLGLAKNADEAVRLATVQSGLSMDMNQLVLTLTNQTTMRFDALGVSVDGFDEKVNELKKSGMSANEAFKEAFLQQAEAQLLKVGNAADESIGSFKRFEAGLKNLADEAKRGASSDFAPMAEIFAKSMENSNSYTKALEISGYTQREFAFRAKAAGMTTQELARSIVEADIAAQQHTNTLEEQGAQAVITAEQLAAIQKANDSIIDGAIEITNRNKDYEQSQQDILDKIAETRAEGEKLYPWEAEKIAENQAKLDELGQSYFDNLEDFKAAMQEKFTLYAVEQIAMSDGVAGFSEAEYEKARIILETTDIATAAAFEEQQAMATLAQAVTDGIIPVEDWGAILDSVMADGVVSAGEVQAAIDAIPKQNTIVFDIITNGSPPNLSPTDYEAPKGTHKNSHSTGGSFMIPASYGIEGFAMGNGDTASGGELINIAPKGQGQDNAALISAMQEIKMDYGKMARAFTTAMQAIGQ